MPKKDKISIQFQCFFLVPMYNGNELLLPMVMTEYVNNMDVNESEYVKMR